MENEEFIFFIINTYKKFNIDILFIWNSKIVNNGNWYGYNSFMLNNLLILWNQNLIIRPEKIDNEGVVFIKDIKLLVAINDVSVNLFDLERNVLFKKKSEYSLLGIVNSNILENNKIKAKINFLDVERKVIFAGRTLNAIKIIPTIFGLSSIGLFFVFRNVECSLGPRLQKIKSKETISDIKNILNNEEPKSILSFKKVFYWNIFRGSFGTISYLLGKIMVNQIAPIFEKWNGLWSSFRKEPFLGKIIPNTVIFSYKILLGDDDNKKYFVSEPIEGIDLDTFTKGTLKSAFYAGKDCLKESLRYNLIMSNLKHTGTSSEAANFDMYRLKDIMKGVKEWFEEKTEGAISGNLRDQNAIRSLLYNIIEKLNKNCDKQYMVAFFLLKDPKLVSASDTRMIVVAPTLFKIFEVIIYNEVVKICNDIMDQNANKWQYQYGARFASSTTKAMVDLRDKVGEHNVKGIMFMDISKGYESVNLKLLMDAIKDFIGVSNLRCRFLLLSWVSFVSNIDIIIAGKVIKRTKGIPMGLMLSPLMFIIYVEFWLRKIDNKQNLIMYIDDIALILSDDIEENPAQSIKKISDNLLKGGLFMNLNKAKLLSDDEKLINQIKEEIPDIISAKVVKYLGRDISMKGESLIPGNIMYRNDIVSLMAKVPIWSPLIIRLSIFNGGLEARNLFQAMMWEIPREVKETLVERARIFYTPCFGNLRHWQLILLLNNYFRLSFSAYMVKEWLKITPNKKNVPINIREKRIEQIKECLKFSTTESRYYDALIDARFRDAENWIDYGIIEKCWNNDYFLFWKNLTRKIWNEYKYMILKNIWTRPSPDAEKNYYWNEAYCWLIGVESKEKGIIYISIIKRFAVLLDMLTGEMKNEAIQEVIYLLNSRLEFCMECIINDLDYGEIDIEFIRHDKIDTLMVNKEFLTKIALLEVLNKDGYLNVLRDDMWIEIMKESGEQFLAFYSLLARAVGGKHYGNKKISDYQVKKQNRAWINKLNDVREKIIKWLLMIDSIYKDQNIELKNVQIIITYMKTMKILYKNELDKQLEIFNLVEFQLEEDERFVISGNLEYKL